MLLRPISHLILYSFTFGGAVFYSYVASPIAFKTLARDQFSVLQSKVFPWFFTMQSLSPVALALTLPIPLATPAYYALGSSSIMGLVNLYGLLPWNKSIKIKRQNDKYAIVENYTREELENLGYSNEEIKARSTLSLYDEILQ